VTPTPYAVDESIVYFSPGDAEDLDRYVADARVTAAFVIFTRRVQWTLNGIAVEEAPCA
jgi:hypothetical protein